MVHRNSQIAGTVAEILAVSQKGLVHYSIISIPNIEYICFAHFNFIKIS